MVTRQMNDTNPLHAKLLYGASMILSAGIWANNFSIGVKILLGTVAGATTLMAFFNQYKTFSKNYSGFWLVIRINYILDGVRPKRSRHRRGISITKKKQ